MDAAVLTVLSELEAIFTIKEEQRMAPKAFLSGRGALLPTGLGKSIFKHHTNRKTRPVAVKNLNLNLTFQDTYFLISIFCWLLPRWLPEINLTDLGKIPSSVSG